MRIPPHAKYEIIYERTKQNGNRLSVSTLCEIAGVSRSGYYNYLSTEDVRLKREEQDRKDFQKILEAYSFRGYNKGARSIYMRLLHMDPPIHMNVKKIRRLMKKYGLFCPIRKANPYRRMAKAMATNNIAPNLVNREFEKHGPRKILLTDITYIINGKAPRVYMSTIIDAYTKEILSWVLSDSLVLDFVLDTVTQLCYTHDISLTEETIIHSDQGAHYTSIKFIELVKDKNLRQSMSRKANCWDNAPQESFFGHMKDEIDKKQLEVDFVATKGSEKYYIQSAFSMPTIEKINQEQRSLLSIPDSFRKIIVVGDNIRVRRDESGIITVGLRNFLLDENSLKL